MSSAHDCPACAIVRGDRVPPGGIVLTTDHYVVHGLDGQSPLTGWMVLTSRQHARALDDLEDPGALESLGPLAQRVIRAQKAALGAEHVYALALGDVLHHFHLHLVPRFADTPIHLRGRGAFDAVSGEAVPAPKAAAGAAALRLALEGAQVTR